MDLKHKHKEIVNTENAPAPVGPYSQAIRANGFLFVSGQIPLIPATGEMAGPDFAAQARQSLENVKAVLIAGHSSLEQVVKVNISLKDMGTFAEFNAIYSEYFNEGKPARACVEVARLPKDCLVEIECIALV